MQGKIAAGLGATILLTGSSVLAEEIRVYGGNCASEVHLVARDAHLADVLKRLAQALDFQLSFESENDPIVSVNAIGEAIDLVARLAPSENVSMTQERNPRCPQRERIVSVWVLPSRQGILMRVATASPQALQAQEAQAQKEQEGFELILKSHGVATTQRRQIEPR